MKNASLIAALNDYSSPESEAKDTRGHVIHVRD